MWKCRWTTSLSSVPGIVWLSALSVRYQFPLTWRSLIQHSLAIPILPLSSLASLQKTLLEFSITLSQSQTQPELPIPATDILPFCSATPPLSEHARNAIIGLVPNLKSLVTAATDGDGRIAIQEALGSNNQQEIEDVIDFWGMEFVNE